MMLIPISALYIALCALIMLWLAGRVVAGRRKTKTGIGTGGHEVLELAVRAHANATEYVPTALILLVALEANGAPGWMVHGLGSTLVVARVLHGLGLGKSGGVSFGRFYGTLATWLVIAIGAIANVYIVIT